uniref:Uncharacterized protein n=1 Tax=Arundo donax TaxID=35708 RepID=A0A0A9E143_ARUDO
MFCYSKLLVIKNRGTCIIYRAQFPKLPCNCPGQTCYQQVCSLCHIFQ